MNLDEGHMKAISERHANARFSTATPPFPHCIPYFPSSRSPKP